MKLSRFLSGLSNRYRQQVVSSMPQNLQQAQLLGCQLESYAPSSFGSLPRARVAVAEDVNHEEVAAATMNTVHSEHRFRTGCWLCESPDHYQVDCPNRCVEEACSKERYHAKHAQGTPAPARGGRGGSRGGRGGSRGGRGGGRGGAAAAATAAGNV